MSNKFLPLDIEHRSNGKLANPQNPKMLACENERDTICVCRLLSLGNLCRRCQTVSPPLHFTSHELVNIIQRHLFSLNVFPSSFLLFLFFLFYIFFFCGFCRSLLDDDDMMLWSNIIAHVASFGQTPNMCQII